jgi:hypothetical protein
MKYFFLLFIPLFISCIPEEDPIVPKDRGDLESGYMDKSIYDYQGFFDLGTNQFISFNSKASWDIAFDCNDNFIIMNGARPVKGAFIDFNNFELSDDKYTPDSLFIDEANGDLINSAMGRWWIDETGNEIKQSKIFYLDRGRDERRRPLGIYKLQVIDWDQDSYTIKYANINDTIIKEMKIYRDQNYNFVYFNFDDSTLTQVEPNKNTWDLFFTEKSEYVPLNAIGTSEDSEAIPYQVRGVYLNPYNVEAILYENLDSLDFNMITRDDVISLNLSKELNVIGYDWKNFSLQGEVYAVDPNKIYIIKDTDGLLYKFRFISFFSKDGGERGYISFEFQQL